MNSSRHSALRSPAFWALAIVATLTLTSPAMAQGTTDIQGFVDNIKGWLTGSIAKSVAVIAVAVCGYRFFSGRASAGPLVAVIGGICLIFGASWVLTQITGG
ncbi:MULTISPECIES: TrbC/VirB2 family protein [unclassified Sphingomonas]|uniref:TrbC/VirB2 family protein n=1 Tax=unclassified Sphingomonas TaxID=196159 RepID=UPI00226A780A|nr:MULTISPECIES: TrbC/VirB2 family protein [unclassified Sphingomonas]